MANGRFFRPRSRQRYRYRRTRPSHLLLNSPLPSVNPSDVGVMLGGPCEFLGFPYGGGWRARFGNGSSAWVPYVKHCFVSALNQEDTKFWVLDGINNAGFSGGPVAYNTGPQQQVFGVISGYITEPADVIPSSPKLAPPKPPAPPKPRRDRKGALRQITTRPERAKRSTSIQDS